MLLKLLVIGPSETASKGGMATVISGIHGSKVLNKRADITVFPSFVDGIFVKRLIYSIFAYLRFLKIYKNYDLFHIHTASYGSTFRKMYYLRTIKRSNRKAIVHIHGAEYLVFYKGLNKSKRKKVVDFLKAADIVIALSDEWKEKFEQTFGLTNCFSLPNGIDTDEYTNAICDVEEHHNEFIFLGRLGQRKGAYDLVDAVEMATEKIPEIKVYMAGDGEVDAIRKLVREKGLGGNIEVVGWVDFSGKIDLLKKSATLVLPSYNEGLPMSILEGMAAGKAIISTTVGAIPEVIHKENGILIQPGDINALSRALIACAENIEVLSSMSKNNISKIDKEFSMKAMHEHLGDLYEMLKPYGV